MIRRPALHEESRLTVMVADVDLSDADPNVLAINQFDDRHLTRLDFARASSPRPLLALPEYEAAEMVDHWTRGALLVCIGTSVVAPALDALLRRHGRMPRWHHQPVDLGAAPARNLLGGGRVDAMPRAVRDALALPWQTASLSRVMGVVLPTGQEWPAAMGLTEWAARLWDCIVPASDEGAKADTSQVNVTAEDGAGE